MSYLSAKIKDTEADPSAGVRQNGPSLVKKVAMQKYSALRVTVKIVSKAACGAADVKQPRPINDAQQRLA